MLFPHCHTEARWRRPDVEAQVLHRGHEGPYRATRTATHHQVRVGEHGDVTVGDPRVSPSTEEIAQEEFKEPEQQRVLGIVPNFYVSYVRESHQCSARIRFAPAHLKKTIELAQD